MSRRQCHRLRDLVAEVLQRAGHSHGGPLYVVRLSSPPTSFERLQLMSARLQRSPIAIMPHPCKTADEWVERYKRSAAPRACT